MGLVYANIELLNGDEVADFERGRIGEDEIRKIEVQSMVDSGSIMLAINEEIRLHLGLRIIDQRPSQLANGQRLTLPVAGTVVVKYAGRICTTNALVLPGYSEVLLGAIPMEEMDLFIHPGLGTLAPLHPDGPLMSLK